MERPVLTVTITCYMLQGTGLPLYQCHVAHIVAHIAVAHAYNLFHCCHKPTASQTHPIHELYQELWEGKEESEGHSEASAVNAAKEKKVTWRMKETSKQIVTKLGARGTRTTELHLRIPRCDATETLYKSSGSRLVNEVITLLNKNANADEIQAYKANPIVTAKWSARSNLLLKCSQPMGEMLKVAIKRSIRKNIPEGQVDEDSDVEVLNRPPTTSLKFMAVPRYNEDGSPTDSADLYSDIKANPLWADVSFFSDPKFLSKDREAASGIVVLTIVEIGRAHV